MYGSSGAKMIYGNDWNKESFETGRRRCLCRGSVLMLDKR